MLLGLDVGGTFTDGAVLRSEKVISAVKTPTTHGNLLEGILKAIDHVVAEVGSKDFTRIALSTTIVTNALVEKKIDTVGLCIMPGPGMDITSALPVKPYILSGYIDHRGHEVAMPRQEEVMAACQHFATYDVFAISGKFSVRNPHCERQVAQWVKQQLNPRHITVGSTVAGTLNFLRRTNSAYYNAAVWRTFNEFATSVELALQARGISSPVYVLKADGGTLPLSVAREYPVEAIFTGPAASVLGMMAMNPTSVPAVSVDIGGTTTDIALWQNGIPLFADGGTSVDGFKTALRSFRLHSLGLGGDSFVRREDGVLKVGPMRLGPAMAVGGMQPTVTDAMVAAGIIDFGNYQMAVEAMKQVAIAGKTPTEVAASILQEVIVILSRGIGDMLTRQAAQPVYRVEDIFHGTEIDVQRVIGVGGAAAGIVPMLAKHLGVSYELPCQGMVANAIGAAVARPTLDITLRADTAKGYYTVAELGIQNKIPGHTFVLADAYKLAAKHLAELAVIRGIELGEIEVIQSEEFNIIRGFRTIGKIITCRLQIKPGVLMGFKEEM